MHRESKAIVSLFEDEYIRGRFEDNTRWVAKLSDGTTAIDDDGRPGTELNSWFRLKNYIEENSLSIIGLYLQFRSHLERLPDNAEGYYLCKGAGAFLNADKTLHYFVAGFLIDGEVRCTWWQIPELLQDRQDIKSLDDELVKKCLIKNPKQ